MSSKKNIVIIGAGVAGLTAGLFYVLDGYNVVILEKNKYPGGLLATDKIYIKGYRSFEIEYFYHHFFKKDTRLVRLLQYLGIKEHLVFRNVPTNISSGYTFKEKMLLASLLVLPTYRPIRYVKVGSVIDVKDSKKGALLRLFKYKFYEYAPNVSLAWLWARLHARFRIRDLLFKEKLGVLEPSSKVLLDALVDRFTRLGGKLITSYNVSSVKQVLSDFKPNKVICTIPPGVCRGLLGNFLNWSWYVPKYIGAYNVVFFIKDPEYDRQKRVPYWTNLLPSKTFPFLVKVRQHILNYSLPLGVIYIGGYAPPNSFIFSLSNNRLKDMALEVLNKNERNRVVGFRVYKTSFAQHVPTVGFYKNKPPFYLGSFKYAGKHVDLELFSFGNITPWDRGVNYAVYPKLLERL